MNQQPIFILGAHKSGTTLLRSLLDGHSHLFVLPFESHFFEHTGYWVMNDYRYQQPRHYSDDELIQIFSDAVHIYNTREDEVGGNFARGKIREEIFQDEIEHMRECGSDKERLETYFRALYHAISGGGMPDDVRVVEKSVEHAGFALELSHFFPEAQFIHMIRNPYANFVSLRRYKSRDFGYPIMKRMLNTFDQSYYNLYRNRRLIENYYVLKYEDLVTTPETQMRNVCDFLNIPFEGGLLTPTTLGDLWESNTSTGESVSRISSGYMDLWQEQIYPVEKYYINIMYPFILQDFGYEKAEDVGSFWKRAKGENLLRYLANRLYFYLVKPTIEENK